MKNAAPIQDSDSALNSADCNMPAFPGVIDAASADVLVFLLYGAKVIGLIDGPTFGADSISIAIHELRGNGWPVEKVSEKIPDKDGGDNYVAAYHLPLSVIDLAFRKGARKWLDAVISRKKRKNGRASSSSPQKRGGESEN